MTITEMSLKNFDLINMYSRLELILKINPKIQFGVGCPIKLKLGL